MDEQKQKDSRTEWSFDFGKVGEQINEFVKSVGAEGDAAIKQGRFVEPIGTARSAHVRIDLSAGETTIRPLPLTSENLIEADLTYVGEIKFMATGEVDKIVSLSQSAGAGEWFRSMFSWLGSKRELRWNIGLTTSLPLDLDVRGGIGESHFDLTGLQLKSLVINGGTGELHALLPVGSYHARVSAGVGETHLTIPTGAAVELELRAGTGEIHLNVAEDVALNANISGGVGECEVRVPTNAPLRLEAKPGIGEISVASRFPRTITGEAGIGSRGGVWQSPNYDMAERKLTFYVRAGVGTFSLR